MHNYDLDTRGLDTSSQRINLKVTTGLTDWLDIYVKGGGAKLKLDYAKESNAIKNFDSDFKGGFGAGTRVRLFNFVDSKTRVYLHGGGYFFKTNDTIEWLNNDNTGLIKDREIKWADMFAGLGISKRIDYVDVSLGMGYSGIKWWINDVDRERIGSSESKKTLKERTSYENKNPIFGFIGFDFVLPLEYRISIQAGINNTDNAEFSIALSQGLEKD
jgi:hypothetical protein